MTIAPRTSVANKPHRVTLQNPFGPPVSNGHGGFTQPYVDLVPPAAQAAIRPAAARDLERITAGTVLSTATHIVTIDYRPQVTTQTRILFHGRALHVTGVANLEERNVELELVCAEVVL